MEGRTRLEAARACLEQLINDKKAFDRDDEAGLISFNDRAEVVAPLKRLANPDQLLRELDKLSHAGSTNLRAALELAWEQLFGNRSPDPAATVRVLILSDGHENHPTAAHVAGRIKNAGAVIQTVGIAGDPETANRSLLEEIASDINGQRQYQYIIDFQGLQRHLTHVSRKLSTTVWPGAQTARP